MSNKIPTWEEAEASGKWDDYDSMYRDLCKLHVEAALKSAAKNGKLKYKARKQGNWVMADAYLDKKSILDAYPLTNIE